MATPVQGYKVKIFKKRRIIQIRSKEADMTKKVTAIGSSDIRQLVDDLASKHFHMTNPHFVRKDSRFFLTGTDTLVTNPADPKYKVGDYEPVLEIEIRES